MQRCNVKDGKEAEKMHVCGSYVTLVDADFG